MATGIKLTRVFKAAVLNAHETFGGDKRFADWAKKNRTEFYQIASRPVPHELHQSGEMEHRYVVRTPEVAEVAANAPQYWISNVDGR